MLAALEEGVDSFESSFGELGGCPVPPGSTGNISTEDLVSMLHEMGIETGIDLPRLIEASRAAQEVLGRPLGAHVLRAGPGGLAPRGQVANRLPRAVTDFAKALEAALAGGPQRHHEKTAEQGKLPVRERVERLVDPGSFAEEGLLANWDEEGLGADGVVTGLATIDGRRVALMANDPTVKAGLLGAEDGREDPPRPGAGAEAAGADGLPGRLGRGADHRPGADVPRAAAAPGASSTTRCGSPARCRRSACCSARAPPAAPTSPPSATW